MSVLKNSMADKFSQLPNELIEDTRISAKAFRVAAYLFSRPTGWNIDNADVMKRLNIKDEGSLSKYWKELIKAGWLNRERQIDSEGKFCGGYDYKLNISPILEKTEQGKDPNEGKNLIGKKPLLGKNPDTNTNTDISSNTEINNKNDVAANAAHKQNTSKSIEERKVAFEKSLVPFLEKYDKETLRAFADYWTESNENGKKMRFEMQKVFDKARRLATWQSRNNTFKPKPSQQEPPARANFTIPQHYVRTQ